jgi:hypothetical protein
VANHCYYGRSSRRLKNHLNNPGDFHETPTRHRASGTRARHAGPAPARAARAQTAGSSGASSNCKRVLVLTKTCSRHKLGGPVRSRLAGLLLKRTRSRRRVLIRAGVLRRHGSELGLLLRASGHDQEKQRDQPAVSAHVSSPSYGRMGGAGMRPPFLTSGGGPAPESSGFTSGAFTTGWFSEPHPQTATSVPRMNVAKMVLMRVLEKNERGGAVAG